CHLVEPSGDLRRIGRRSGNEYDLVHARIAIASQVVGGDSLEIGRHHYLDLGGLSSTLAKERAKASDLFAGLGRVKIEAEPSVADIRDPLERGAALAAEQDRECGAAGRLGKRSRIVEVHE